ncbi:uncharacterized protein [Cherax quadricarinatus]|nr:uncharacterized protein LOC128689151 [Cherax quadricarinatus]
MECCTLRGRPWLVVDSCCCCSLKRGVYIIASLEILACFVSIILLLVHMKFPDMVGRILELLAHIVITSILIYGVKKSRRHLVMGWLWMRSVMLMTDLSVFAIDSILIFHTWPLFAIISVVFVGLCCAMVVVRSYALTMTATEEDEVNLQAVTTTTTHTRLHDTDDLV